MKFGSVPVKDTKGAMLAHALVLPDKRLKKGHVLTSKDVHMISNAGIEDVVVARLENGDVEENKAAERIGKSLVGEGFSTAEAFTGRVNIYAEHSGILSINRETVDAINRVTPEITLATLHDGVFVEAGRMVATVKIIPFAVTETHIGAVEEIALQNATLTNNKSKPARVGLIATKLPSLKPKAMDKTAKVLAERLAQTGSQITREIRIGHNEQELSEALLDIVPGSDLIVIFGASAITDNDDVIPAALRHAGGAVDQLGMPVDPGNLLMIGRLKGVRVIGAPGCARSPSENGFDWVLQRVLCGLPVDDLYISGLGVGGLLMEISMRPQPREV